MTEKYQPIGPQNRKKKESIIKSEAYKGKSLFSTDFKFIDLCTCIANTPPITVYTIKKTNITFPPYFNVITIVNSNRYILLSSE